MKGAVDAGLRRQLWNHVDAAITDWANRLRGEFVGEVIANVILYLNTSAATSASHIIVTLVLNSEIA